MKIRATQIQFRLKEFIFDEVFEKDDSYNESIEIMFDSIVARLIKQFIAQNFPE